MVTLAGTGTLPARRQILTMVSDKDVVRHLFDDIAPRFIDRPGGYTRIMRLGRRRGDGADLAIIEFVDYDLADHEDGESPSKGGKKSLMDRAKGMFGGGAKADEPAEKEAAAVEAEAGSADDAETAAAEQPEDATADTVEDDEKKET
jgi:large subunit ribosomal protein L17